MLGTHSPSFLRTGSSQGPPAKRPRYFEVDPATSDEEDSDEEFDPQSYYATDSGEEIPKEVTKFLESTFKRCLPRKRRRTEPRHNESSQS